MADFNLLLIAASILSGAIASVTGFGIGSILTPLLALQVGTKTAVAVIAIPHFAATLIRFWMVRGHVNRKVLLGFGVASAAGGLGGALLHSSSQSSVLTLVFGALLVFAGFMGITGLTQKMAFHGPGAWIAGVLSGGFGGLVGNQGGIRSAALMAFDLPKESLVATATAVGIVVDLARMPVYFASEHHDLYANWGWMLTATVGVVIGTGLGIKFLHGISETMFRRVLGVLIFLLGVYMIISGAKTA